MNQAERREAIKQILNARRSEKIENLAAELNVSVRTIKYDIEALACSYPGVKNGGTFLRILPPLPFR